MGKNSIGEMTKELARLCSFTNPGRCTNHENKAPAITIMNNANVPIPKEAQLAHQGHKHEVCARPYGRINNVTQKMLQDGLCAMPIN